MNLEKAVVTYQDDTNECSKQKLLKKMMNYYYPVVKEYCLGILGKVDEDLIQCGVHRSGGKHWTALTGQKARSSTLLQVL